MKHLSSLLALSLLMLGLGACGQSGPLYLPPPPNKTPSQMQTAPRAVPAQAPGPNLNQTPTTDPNVLFKDNSGDSGLNDNSAGD